MSFTPIIFFLLIGLAHWTAHILECVTCRQTVIDNNRFFLEGLTHIFGWPLQAVDYLLTWIRAPRTGLTSEDVEKAVKERVNKFLKEMNAGGAVLSFSQQAGESDEAFNARVAQSLSEHTKQKEVKNERTSTSGT